MPIPTRYFTVPSSRRLSGRRASPRRRTDGSGRRPAKHCSNGPTALGGNGQEGFRERLPLFARIWRYMDAMAKGAPGVALKCNGFGTLKTSATTALAAKREVRCWRTGRSRDSSRMIGRGESRISRIGGAIGERHKSAAIPEGKPEACPRRAISVEMRKRLVLPVVFLYIA